MKYEETKNKLEEYRQKKAKEEAQSSRRQFIWDIVTLQPIRRNLSRNKTNEENRDKHGNKPPNDDAIDDEEIKDRTWTRIDYAIFFVKLLVWACIQVLFPPMMKSIVSSTTLQMIFVKIEFGSVFFIVSCILFMTSNLGKR